MGESAEEWREGRGGRERIGGGRTGQDWRVGVPRMRKMLPMRAKSLEVPRKRVLRWRGDSGVEGRGGGGVASASKDGEEVCEMGRGEAEREEEGEGGSTGMKGVKNSARVAPSAQRSRTKES